ncbi:hypothetical protein VHEMI07275 [[Torrubiella] hemipterigena]|uniref:Uncharacterized protein n=1 Tax=[Torrubiella] hemipterigena TaxID=1531966 RepID=A0A0A1TLD2_9HYPO|nr:hypothetical protein VHEMI07275 [[Torrubiella] hemipterigena]
MSHYEPSSAPVWGFLPSEQYLLHHWNRESEETVEIQRQRLIRDFVRNVDETPFKWDIVRLSTCLEAPPPLDVPPTEGDIETILAPWRSQSLRFAAAKIWNTTITDCMVWVRTHYDADEAVRQEDDVQFAAWVAEIDDENHFNGNPSDDLEQALKWLILEDESRFNVGRDWELVLDIMPELIIPYSESEGGAVEAAAQYRDPRQWRRVAKRVQQYQEEMRDKASKLTSTEDLIALVESANILQELSLCAVVILADKDAFAQKRLKMVFVDGHGHTIRYALVDNDDCWWEVRSELFRGTLDGNPYWLGEEEGSGVGPAYKADGVVGKELYGIQDLL